MICRNCGEETKNKHFCSKSCNVSFNNKGRKLSDKTKEKIRESVILSLRDRKKKPSEHTCEKCEKKFEGFVRKGRRIRCNDCKRKSPRKNENANSILDLSKRTIKKILKRANKGCAICGWKEANPVKHHIEFRMNGGKDADDNLILVCPNHHAIIHENKKAFDVAFLRSRCIAVTFKNWRDYYAVETQRVDDGMVTYRSVKP